MRKTLFANGEFYHVYNRGVDKRNIIDNTEDVSRFLQSMQEFNVIDPIGSIYEHTFLKEEEKHSKPLVDFICYCINPNHYHFFLKQVKEKGIEKFLHRFGTGYTKYFNQKYKRSGSLFQGSYKAIHVDSNEYLLRLSAYINLNNCAHQLGSLASKLSISSWDEYTKGKIKNPMCQKSIILNQFSNKKEYANFAQKALQDIVQHKDMNKELQAALIEDLEA